MKSIRGRWEKRYIRKNGVTVWTRICVSLARDQHHLPQYFISVIEDITDRIQAERSLRESEQRLRLALSAGVGVWDCDLRAKAPMLSPQYNRVFGQPPLASSDWLKLVHPDDRERVMSLVRKSIDRRSEWEAEFRLLGPDGDMRWLLSKGTVLPGDDGRPERMLGVSLDITQRKQAEAALRVVNSVLNSPRGPAELVLGTGMLKPARHIVQADTVPYMASHRAILLLDASSGSK